VTTQRVCKRAFVSGRVQGVFYRATAAREARSLGLAGYARNLADGRVEVLACGAEPSVDTFLRWLWVGSSASRVTGVEVLSVATTEATGIGADFVSR
jgi:acylphosphatase